MRSQFLSILALLFAFCVLFGGNVWADTRDLLTEGFTSMSLSTSYSSTGWYAYNAGSGNNWTVESSDGHNDSYCARYHWNSSYAANCYLVSAPFTVDARMTNLSVELYEKIGSTSWAETFEVFFVKASDVTTLAGVASATHYSAISSITDDSNTNYVVRSGSNSNSALCGQSVRVVVHCTSAADKYYLYIDDIKVTETYTPVPPYAAEWVSADFGSSKWCIGEEREVVIQVKNTGTATWYNSTANGGDGSQTQTDHDIVALSYKWDEDPWYDSHPNTRNHFSTNVAPGETTTITVTVEGPRKSGSNHLRFNLIRQECCWFSYQNDCSNAPEYSHNITVTEMKLTASNKIICTGGSSNLTTNCSLTGDFYEYEPYIWDWNSASYNSGGGITDVSVSGSIIKFTTTNTDPQIPMYNIGHFDPSIYKTFKMRYRIISGSPGGMQVYHTYPGNTTATVESQAHYYSSLNADHQWHIMEMNMLSSANTPSMWSDCGEVLGWRLDVCSASGVTMEIDWVGLFPDPIETEASSLTVNPTQTTNYCVCNYMTNRSCIHKATANVEVAPNPTITVSASTDTECINSGSQVIYTASTPKYGLNVTSGTFSSISGTSSVSGDDSYSGAISIGFTFNYWGVNYTTAVISTNGFLKLGDGAGYHVNSLASTSYYNYLAAFWDDLYATSTKYATLGSAPNRVFVMQHDGYRLNDGSNTFSFQIRLYETTNVIEFCYGSGFPNISNSSTTASIGLNNYADGATSFISVTPTGAGTATISTTEANNSIGTTQCDYLTSGTIYRFTPLPNYTYSWTKVSGTGGTASGTGKNTYTVSPTALSNTYTVRVTNSGCSATSETLTITTKPTVTVASSVNGSDACDGSDVLLSAASNATDFVWSNNAGTEPVVTVHPRSSTTYYVTASSATCTNSASISVNVKTSPTITASPDPVSVCFDGSTAVTLTASTVGNVICNASDYTFTRTTGTYTELTNPTILLTGNSTDGLSTSIATFPDGFEFPYCGVKYSGIYISDGCLRFGSSSMSYSTMLSSTTYYDMLAPFSSDLYMKANTQTISYKLTGDAPNRVLTIQFKDATTYPDRDGSNKFNFQVKLHENGEIEFCYGSGFTTIGSYYTYATTCIGINNYSGSTTYYQQITPTDGGATVQTSGTLTQLTVDQAHYITSGTIYKFTPPTPPFAWTYTGTSGTASGATYTVTPSEGTNTYTVSVDGCSRTLSINVLNTNNITASSATTDCGKKITLSASGVEGATYNWYDGNTLVQENSSAFTPTNIIEGKTYNVKVSKDIYGDIAEVVRNFEYTGSEQSVTIPEGTIAAKLEVWGAQGGTYSSYTGGLGGYSVGTLTNLSGVTSLKVYVGGAGTTNTTAGYNGGGAGVSSGRGGGGATDIRLGGSTLYDRIIVAGGGGGAGVSYGSAYPAGCGGGEYGGDGYYNYTNGTYVIGNYRSGGGATQTSGGISWNSQSATQGTFGQGGNASTYSCGGGGGGWYGGGGAYDNDSDSDGRYGGGGSGYVWTSATASSAPSGYNVSSSYYLTDAQTIAGNATMPNPAGSTMTGREGNGYARITFYIQHHITCASQPKQVALTVTPLTTPSAQDQTICPGNTATLSVDPAVSGYTYHWESGSDSGTGNSFTTASLDNTTTYQITATKAFDEIVAAYDFDYSGEMQDVVAPSGADYAILEVWGAQGGSSQTDGELKPIGGLGGYATGQMNVSAGQHFYVVVGGKGQDGQIGPNTSLVTAIGGYNGGGAGTCDGSVSENGNEEGSGGGGGATHIAMAAPSSGTDYQLYYYSSNQDDVLLVAGGGGGASWQTTGGYGGGTAGGRVSSGGSGGKQTANTSTSGNQILGIFGRGANGSGAGDGNGVAGGGGGWYGGNACSKTGGPYNAGGGGSGHINASQLTNTTILAGNSASIPNIAGTGTETGHSGNGHARIVFYKNGGGECVSSVANVDAIVNTPSVGTLTFTTDQNICPGTAVTLQVNSANPTASEGLSYVWKKGTSTLGTSSSYETTAEGTYNVKVTATNIMNGKTCTADQSQNIAVTYKKPSAEEREELGIANNYYVWTGYSSNWTEVNNWMKYTSNTDKYTLTEALPTSNINVVIGKYSTCVSENPVLNIDDAANTKVLKVGSDVTISGSNTLTVAGTLTNKGTLNAPLEITGALTNSGTVNSSLTMNGTYTLTNNGTLNAPAVFNGTTTLANGSTTFSTTFSSVTINSGKTLKTSSHNITISGDCTNNGTLTAGAGSITMTGNLANNGIFTASTGAITMTGNLTNSGTFNGAGGTISITGNLTNASTFKTAAGALSLNGNLTNSGTFTIGGAGAVTLTGNWTNNGTFTPTGAGAVIFAGTSSQVIGGTNATTFKNVQFNNTANGLSISNEPTITGTATFSSGVVSGNVTLGSAATVSGASTNSYVNGKVTKVMNANATFKFPIGTSSLYAPFEAKSSAASNVSVQYASGSEDMPDVWNHSGNFSNVGLDHASDRENWQVSASATTNLSAIKLYWNTAAGNYHSFEEGADALASYLRIAAVKKNGFYWQNLGQSAIEGDFDGVGSITAATPLAITVGAKAAGDNDYFVTFASTNKGNLLLPIELTSFTATCDGRSTLVEWTTASERNNDYFVIERSDDAINFTEIARVAGAGNSIEPLDYSYTDYGIHGGDNYFRLVQVDYDGTRTVSEIVFANCIESDVEEPEVQAYPNPFNGELTLVLDNFDNRPATIEVYDMLGKLIYIQKADAPLNSYETILNLSNLPTGAYNVRVSTADFVINKNVVKN